MSKRREHKLEIALSTVERTELLRRAKMHRSQLAPYVRAVALGRRPTRRGDVARAEEWWEGLTPEQRVKLHRWLSKQPRDVAPRQSEALPLDLAEGAA